VDSHLSLPTVAANDLDADIRPFARNPDLPWLMTAHILFPAFDPTLPATLSPAVLSCILRGRIGFNGVAVTDDLAMKALSGEPTDLARQALSAGCDLALYCSGEFPPTESLLRACPSVSATTRQRLRAAWQWARRRRMPLDIAGIAVERERLLAG
jgi:beta-N-acetylhexosaminidase